MQPLVFAIVAFLYVIGSIVKAAKSNKAKQEGQEQSKGTEEWKPLAVSKGVQMQIIKQPARPVAAELRRQLQPAPAAKTLRPEAARPQTVMQRIARMLEQAIQGQIPQIPEKEELPEQIPEAQPVKEEMPEVTSRADETMHLKGIEEIEEIEEVYLEDVFDYSDPDELKRAILHYEILGKPVSLRNPSERMAGF